VIHALNRSGTVLSAELFNELVDGVSELPHYAVDLEIRSVLKIILPKARVKASDDVISVLVDDHRRGPEDHQI
jgi:hypothetical protein